MKSNECDISILFKEVILDPSKNIALLAFWFFACIILGNTFFFMWLKCEMIMKFGPDVLAPTAPSLCLA